MLGTKRRFFGNIVGHAAGVTDPSSLSSWTAEAFDHSLDWKRIGQICEMWDGKVILKGILDVEDAKKAAELGVDAIIVSNHGGRQLDGALSSIRMLLPPILDAVGDKVEVHLDSGIRSGQDVLKAVAMGAKGTYDRARLCLWSGRQWAYTRGFTWAYTLGGCPKLEL
jgi:L-lactate dehydrogenase (cytochrome)